MASPVHAEAGAAPAVLPHEAVPRRRRGPDLAQPLGEDGEPAGRDVTIFGRGDEILDRPDTSEGVSRDGDMRGQED